MTFFRPAKVVNTENKVTKEIETDPANFPDSAADSPSLNDDIFEKPLDINDLLIDNPTATFFVRVKGDSMEGVKIFADDILVVDRSITPVSGKIVVAAVHGEMMVRRLEISKNIVSLKSEQVDCEPIYVTGNDDCFIWGVVVGSVRVI